jgi:hypothetical protein
MGAWGALSRIEVFMEPRMTEVAALNRWVCTTARGPHTLLYRWALSRVSQPEFARAKFARLKFALTGEKN